MTRRDLDAERDLARRREELGIVDPEEHPIISTPHERRDGNGKKWWRETWGKALGSVLAAAIIAGATWLSMRVYTINGLPPRVSAVEAEVQAIKASPMPPAQIRALALEIVKAMPPSRGKP